MVKFSIIGPAIKSHLYSRFYQGLNKNNTNFEVVFVGNKPLTESMPDNFIYIYSESSPACCLEIAARKAQGEYLMISPDDYTFSNNFLDNFKKYLDSCSDEKMMIAGKYKRGGDMKDEWLVFDQKIKGSSPIGQCTTLKREEWLKLGGIDRRFEHGCCDMDMIMRMYEIGYKLHIEKNTWVEEDVIKDKKIRRKRLWKKTGKARRALLNSLWVKNGKMSKKRLGKLYPFSEDIV